MVLDKQNAICVEKHETSDGHRLHLRKPNELSHEVMAHFIFRKLFFSNAHVQLSSGSRCLIFGRTLRQLPHFMCANSEGYGKTAQMRGSPEPSLVAYVISTIISWAGSNTACKWLGVFSRPSILAPPVWWSQLEMCEIIMKVCKAKIK